MRYAEHETMLGVSNPFNPQHNVGLRALRAQATFSGNVQLALAAYNAGPQLRVAAGYTVPAIAKHSSTCAVFSPL